MGLHRMAGIAGSVLSSWLAIGSTWNVVEAMGVASNCDTAALAGDADISYLLQHTHSQAMATHEVRTGDFGTLAVTKMAGGTAASVRFEHQGQLFKYHLYAESIFVEGATQEEVTANGTQQVKYGPVRTFRSRQEGKWAAATLHDDGSVYGLFQDHVHGSLLKVVPNPMDKSPVNQSYEPGAEDFTSIDRKLHIIVPSRSENKSYGRDDNSQHNPNAGRRDVPRWFPGCFPEDDTLQIMTVGLIADAVASQSHGKFGNKWGLGDVSTQMQAVVNIVSMIFEAQLNIKLQAAYQRIYAKGQGPAWSTECNSVPSKRQGAEASAKADADYHALFSGCDNLQPMGQSPGGAVCSGSVLYVLTPELFGAGPEAGWVTFAHESGHMFGATKHPVEWCMAWGINVPGDNSCRGGLMDAYSPATVPMWEPTCTDLSDDCLVRNGAYAFHEVHKREICAGLSRCNFRQVSSKKDSASASTIPAATESTASSAARIFTTTTTTSSIASRKCKDNPDFQDRWWYQCSSWLGHDCTKKRAFYSLDELHEVASNCPKSCKLCS